MFKYSRKNDNSVTSRSRVVSKKGRNRSGIMYRTGMYLAVCTWKTANDEGDKARKSRHVPNLCSASSNE